MYANYTRIILRPAIGFLALNALWTTPALSLTGSRDGIMTPAPYGTMIAAVKGDTVIDGSKALIEDIAGRGIGFLSDSSLSEDRREAEFRDLLNDAFDMETIGRFALGRYWKSATAEERKEYQKLFNSMIVRVYTARFKEYDGQKLEVTGARKDTASEDVIVNTLIIPKKGNEKFTVEWRVRKKGGKYNVVDILVEGVSMALTQRSDFASVIQRGGGKVEVLLEHLRK